MNRNTIHILIVFSVLLVTGCTSTYYPDRTSATEVYPGESWLKYATPEEAEEVHKFIRELLSKKYGKDTSESLRIQYGGSVKPANIESLIKEKDIDGALIGGASLKADSFADIVKKNVAIDKGVNTCYTG